MESVPCMLAETAALNITMHQRCGSSRRVPRAISISQFTVRRDPDGDRQDVHFEVQCSKGTYIRSLAYDIGRTLGSVAHLTALRYTRRLQSLRATV